MKGSARRVLLGFLAAVTLAFAAPSAQVAVPDGLINVGVGDVTILEDVNIDVAARFAANVCGVGANQVAALGRAVDRNGGAEAVCTANQRPVTLRQN